MIPPEHPAYLLLFVAVVAPAGAVVIVSALLLFGVHPRVVFAPGWALMSVLRSANLRPPNAVGVASTVGMWWFLIVLAGMLRERLRQHTQSRR